MPVAGQGQMGSEQRERTVAVAGRPAVCQTVARHVGVSPSPAGACPPTRRPRSAQSGRGRFVLLGSSGGPIERPLFSLRPLWVVRGWVRAPPPSNPRWATAPGVFLTWRTPGAASRIARHLRHDEASRRHRARSGTRTPDWLVMAGGPESGYPWSCGRLRGTGRPARAA